MFVHKYHYHKFYVVVLLLMLTGCTTYSPPVRLAPPPSKDVAVVRGPVDFVQRSLDLNTARHAHVFYDSCSKGVSHENHCNIRRGHGVNYRNGCTVHRHR